MTDDIWKGTDGPRDAKIALVGEGWGVSEQSTGRPFSGGSGEELTRILSDAGIRRADCFLTNVAPILPPVNKKGRREFYMCFEETSHARKTGVLPLRGLYPLEAIRSSLKCLYLQLAAIRPSIIVALGNYALWALTDARIGLADEEGRKVPTGITAFRGSQHLKYKPLWGDWANPPPVIPTFNPAAILNNWEYRAPCCHDFRSRVAVGPQSTPPYNFITRPSYAQTQEILQYLSQLRSGSWLARDYETARGHIDCLGIAWSEHDAICIPFTDLRTGDSPWSLDEELSIRRSLDRLFHRTDLQWAGQNANYEAQYEHQWSDSTTDFRHDTMIAHHLLWPGTPMDLTYLSSLYCKYHRYWGEANWWETSGNIEERWTYNCEDACRTWEIAQTLESLVDKMNFRLQFEERMEVARANLDIMLRGIKIDVPLRQRFALQVFTLMQEMEGQFESIMPAWIPPLLVGKGGKPSPWFRSPTQLMRLFYDLWNQPEHIDKKRKTRTVDDDALQKIAQSEPLLSDLCTDILAYRSAGVYYSNSLTAGLEPSGRLKCAIGEGPISFRMRSGENAFGRGTNLQNIPKLKDE